MKTGIVGCGFIGGEISSFIEKSSEFQLVGLNDIDEKKYEILAKKLKSGRPKFMGLDELIKKSELVIEAASRNVVEKILIDKNLDKKGKKLLIMSTGGLVGKLNLLKKMKSCQVYMPSGAIAGLDAIKAASGRIKSLSLTTTKSPKSLEGAPYIIKNGINLKKIKDKKLIFEGPLEDAVEGFPQNINVAATLFLASGFRKIKVRIVADPGTKFNTHEILAEGDFGMIKAATMNLPSKNPKTSYLAVLSAINILKGMKKRIRIGN